MNNAKGFGLIGFLLAVVLAGILMTLVLKQYTNTVSRGAGSAYGREQKGAQQKETSGRNVQNAAGPQQKKAPPVPACDGKQVGTVCVPTRMHSGQDDFEKLYK